MLKLLFFPILMLKRLLGFFFGLFGRVMAIGLGLGCMVVGILISFTVVGACLGIPMAVVGFALILRGIF